MKTYTIRIEKDARLTYRTPAGRAIGWGSPVGLADILRSRKRKYRLDLHQPLLLKNLKTDCDVNHAYALQQELSRLTAEEWATLVIHPETARPEHILLFDPETVQMQNFCGFPIQPLLSRCLGSWAWIGCPITPSLAKELGLTT